MHLKVLRVIRGFSQLDLMLKTGIHQSRISLFENGYADLKPEERAKLAKVLGCKGEDIENSRAIKGNRIAINGQ